MHSLNRRNASVAPHRPSAVVDAVLAVSACMSMILKPQHNASIMRVYLWFCRRPRFQPGRCGALRQLFDIYGCHRPPAGSAIEAVFNLLPVPIE
jgi:hypothetical protein